MAWNPQPTIGNALWSGNAPVVTTAQLVSTVSSLSITGDTSTWANYPAITTVNLQNFDIISTNNLVASNISAQQVTAKFLSTLDLQVSTINGAEFIINGGTAIIGGVTIANSSMTVINMKLSDNGTGTGKSGGTVVETATNAIGAVANTVFQAQSAVSGLLSGTGSVLMQTYYGVAAAGAAVDLINKTVTLATNAQALYDSRQQNFIAGPGGPPGQTSYVYETINGTTQFQFSTLASPVTSVYRTTDQQFPNQTFGREIFTSSIIPAGSKVVRSVSDPYQFPIISTQLLSTTNYLQSFGQWHSIIEPEYNLFVSTLTANNVSTNQLSVAQAWISSVNGVDSAFFLNPTTLPNLAATYISTGQVTTSSIIVTSGLVFSTAAGYNITRTTVSTTGTYDSVSSVTQNFLNYQMTLTARGASFDMGWLYQITTANESFWSHKQFSFNQPFTSDKFGVIDITYGSYTNGDYFDIKNLTTAGNSVLVYNSVESNNLLFIVAPGTFYRVTYSSGTNSWTYAANPTQTAQTTVNSFNIAQGWDNTILSTNNNLTINAATTSFPGIVTAKTALTTDLIAEYAYVSTLQVQNASISSLLISTSYTQNIIDNYLSTTTAFFDQVFTSSLKAVTVNTSSLTTPSLNVISTLTFSTPMYNTSTVGYDISKTYNLTSTSFSTISSLTNNILQYTFNATVGDETSFNIGAGYVLAAANAGQWASTILQGNNTGAPMILQIVNDPATGFGGTGTFDVQRVPVPGNTPYDIAVVYSLGGTTLVDIGTSDYSLYRFSKASAGQGNWTYTNSGVLPYITTNNNTFQIYQSLTDLTIATTDNLNLNAGSIKFNGAVQFPDITVVHVGVQSMTASTMAVTTANISTALISSLTTTSIVNNGTFSLNANTSTLGTIPTTSFPINTIDNFTTVGYVSTNSSFYVDTLVSTVLLNNTLNYNTFRGYYSAYVTALPLASTTDFRNTGLIWQSTTLTPTPFQIPAGATYNFSVLGLRFETTTGSTPAPPTINLGAPPASGGYFYLNLTPYGGGTNHINLTGAVSPSGLFLITDVTYVFISSGSTWYFSRGLYGDYSYGSAYQQITNSFDIIQYPSYASLKTSHTGYAPALSTLVSTIPYGLNFDTSAITINTAQSFNFIIYGKFGGAQSGYIPTTGNSGTYNGQIQYNGLPFYAKTYNCTVSLVGFHIETVGCAVDQVNVSCYVASDGTWWVNAYFEVQGGPYLPTNNRLCWDINYIFTPPALFNGTGLANPLHSDEPAPILSTIQGPTILASAIVSTMVASTFTVQASENMSLLAGAFAIPTYVSTGNITVGGSGQVSVLGNIVAIGGATDVDIQANNNNVNIVANSTITLQGTRFDNVQGAIITSTPTYYVLNSNITATSLVFLTPASPIDKPYWVTYDPGTDFCINVSSLATPTVMNYWVASYSGYGLQLSAGSVVATGGTVTTISGRRFHTFTTNGSFVLSSTPGATIEIMIIGGGGGGGGWNAGGGGAGNLIVFQYVLTVGSYAVTLGAGGLGGIQSLSIGSQGSSTTFDVLATALGGGGGGTVFTGGGGNGGCGGGGSEVSPYDVPGSGITGTASGTVVQNLATSGGAGTNAGSQGGGGGGGCTVAGSTNSGGSGGAGGNGYTYYGSVYGGGGGGGAGAVGGSGGASGSGGGGAGSGVGISPGIDGTANTGGGGGGVNFGTGGAGGSGICIVSYTYP